MSMHQLISSPLCSSSKRRKLDVASIPELPDHIIYLILLKSPVKAVIRFCSLSKRWQETITNSSSFAKQHMQSVRELKSTAASVDDIYLVGSRFDRFVHHVPSHRISMMDCGRQIIRPVKIRFDSGRLLLARYLSCDGLLCIAVIGPDVSSSFIHIQNPATGKHKNLIWPPLLMDNMMWSIYYDSFMGFGYDASIDDYKVVVLVPKWRAQVMSLKEATWRTVDLKTTSPCMSQVVGYNDGKQSVSVNGDIYWIMVVRSDLWYCVLLKFNLAEESFSLLPLPKDTCEMEYDLKIITFKESLFLFTWEGNRKSPNVDMWMIQGDTTWCQIGTIPILEYGVGHRTNMPRLELHPVGFNMSGHVILFDVVDDRWIVYILQENKFVKLGLANSQSFDFHFVHMDTLVSP